MEVLMPRFSRNPVSRTVVSLTVIAIAIGAAYQFHHLHHSIAAPPPLTMSVAPNPVLTPPVLTPVVKDPVPVKPQTEIKPTTPVIKPLVTQTPDPTKPFSNTMPHGTVVSNNPVQTPVKPLTNTTPAPTPQPVAASSASLIVDATAKVTAGDLLGARTQLNTALLSGSLDAADTTAVKKQMAEINQTLVFSPKQFPKDPLGGIYTVKSGDRMAAIGVSHNIPYELLLPLNRMTDARKLRYGQALKVINGPFHAVITKSKFTLDVYLGSPAGPDSTYITTFNVGLGTDNSTPTGTWKIKDKVTHPAYFPPAEHPGPTLLPDDPKNPLGPYWMGLEGTDGLAVGQRSYGIHGTIDPTSIGKQSSMGCIRLKNEDVEIVYKLLVQEKSIVVVKD
jgi:lipoprotein-anchoring transpeptidase ErfK/SrfK